MAISSQPRKGKATKYFAKEKRLLRFAGLSFDGNESRLYLLYSFLFIFLLNFLYPLLEFIEIFKQDIEVISDMLIYLFAIYLGLAKTVVVFLNRVQIGKMLDRLEGVPFTANVERGGVQEEEMIKKCVWITHMQTVVYWMICFGSASSSIMFSFIKMTLSENIEAYELPFGPLTVLNITYSPNFEITWCYQIMSILSVTCHFTTIDLLLAAVLAHLSSQFKMLQNCIRTIVKKCYIETQKDKTPTINYLSIEADFEVDVSTIPWKYLHKHLKQSVKYHLEITELVKDMEHVFSKLLLVVFLGTLGLLCFTVYRSSVVDSNTKVLIHMSQALCAALQVLTVCYWGEQVVSESQQVGFAAYDANFIGADLRFQKSLVLIIRRSQNPTKLTAGKFSDICLATFAWTIRTSYSAFMVVRRAGSDRATLQH